MRLKLLILIACVAVSTCAWGADIDISGAKVSVIGFGVSRSTSGRLVNILSGDPLAQPQKTIKGVYIPAGTRLALLDRSYNDAQGRTWMLVSTEDGILAYLRGLSKGSSRGPAPQYWTQTQIERFFGDGTDQIAVVQAPQAVKSESYGAVALTASEIYRVDAMASPPDGMVALVLDKSKLGEAWTVNETIIVPEQSVALISRSAFDDVSDLERPFGMYDPIRDIMDAVDATIAIKSLPDAGTLRQKARDFLSSRFIATKSCETEIVFKLDTEVDAAVGLSGLLSPVEAKLKLSGTIAGAIKYAKGEEFQIVRVRQPGDVNIYEIKSSSDRLNCSAGPTSRIVVAATDGTQGEINEASLKAAGFGDLTKGSPVYTCRTEFFALRDILANKAFLPQTISAFVVANFAEFRGASDPSICSPNKV